MKATHMKALQILAVIAAAQLAGCASPTAPTPPSAPPPSSPAVTPTTITGRVIAANGGQAIIGARVEAMGQQTISDNQGRFSLTLAPGITTYVITVSASGIETLRATAGTANELTLPVIAHGRGFDPAFYRQFVFDANNIPTILRRQAQAPRIYLQTVDDTGTTINAVTLETVAAALINTVGSFTGGQFGIAAMERGTGTRLGQPGWITVRWSSDPASGVCGQANVYNGDLVTLFHRNPRCSCGSSAMRPRTVKHELGHAMGFYHTGHADDLMSGLSDARCDQDLSERERAHIAIAYSRPIGTSIPDTWPSSTIASAHATATTERQ